VVLACRGTFKVAAKSVCNGRSPLQLKALFNYVSVFHVLLQHSQQHIVLTALLLTTGKLSGNDDSLHRFSPYKNYVWVCNVGGTCSYTLYGLRTQPDPVASPLTVHSH